MQIKLDVAVVVFEIVANAQIAQRIAWSIGADYKDITIHNLPPVDDTVSTFRITAICHDVNRLRQVADLIHARITDHNKKCELLIDQLSDEGYHLKNRTFNCLHRAGIKTLGDLIQKTEEELLQIRNFGTGPLADVKQLLLSMELFLSDETITE